MVSVYDHVRPADGGPDSRYPADVYRVVGTSDRRVTLLRVADADGRRRHTGELVAVDAADFEAFEPAANPDGNRPVGAAVASRLSALGWWGRVFARNLADRPLPASGALALVAAGYAGPAVVPLSDAASGALILAGSLGLAAVGSGRL